jgi:hypothetical protein
MNFRIRGVDPQPFVHLYGRSDAELATHGAVRYVADESPGFPDRVALRDVEIGAPVLLVNHLHLDVAGPYRASHAIFIAEGAQAASELYNQMPESLRIRMLSIRAFDVEGMMIDADLVEGTHAESLVERLFENPRAAYLHAHFARRGCFACRIDRETARVCG